MMTVHLVALLARLLGVRYGTFGIDTESVGRQRRKVLVALLAIVFKRNMNDRQGTGTEMRPAATPDDQRTIQPSCNQAGNNATAAQVEQSTAMTKVVDLDSLRSLLAGLTR